MTGAAGVNYDVLDRFKVWAQESTKETFKNIEYLGLRVIPESLGESAFLIEGLQKYSTLATVTEGLGTKILVADAMYQLGRNFYCQIAYCNAATAINDLITTGAVPVSLSMHLAIGSPEWLKNENRVINLINGHKYACDAARCAWSGGETPELQKIINPETAELSCSAQGVIKDLSKIVLAKNIKAGDTVVLIGSSGIHANGLTRAREVADKLPWGYLTRLDDMTYGETLLNPSTIIYAPLMAELADKVDIHYAVNITGHGWLKLMRAPHPFTYVIEKIPESQPVFRFIIDRLGMSLKDAYTAFNMGAGFALYVAPEDVAEVVAVAERLDINAWKAGYIEQGEKKVIIKPLGIEFLGEELKIR